MNTNLVETPCGLMEYQEGMNLDVSPAKESKPMSTEQKQQKPRFKPSKVLIFEEADGYHWNYDNQTDTLDARGKGYPSKAAAMRAARENFEWREA